MSFPGRREVPNTLHSSKMLAPHFEDEIAGLQKWPFLASFWPFLAQFIFIVTHNYGQTTYVFSKRIVPRILFMATGRLQTFYIPLLKGHHRLLD